MRGLSDGQLLLFETEPSLVVYPAADALVDEANRAVDLSNQITLLESYLQGEVAGASPLAMLERASDTLMLAHGTNFYDLTTAYVQKISQAYCDARPDRTNPIEENRRTKFMTMIADVTQCPEDIARLGSQFFIDYESIATDELPTEPRLVLYDLMMTIGLLHKGSEQLVKEVMYWAQENYSDLADLDTEELYKRVQADIAARRRKAGRFVTVSTRPQLPF